MHVFEWEGVNYWCLMKYYEVENLFMPMRHFGVQIHFNGDDDGFALIFVCWMYDWNGYRVGSGRKGSTFVLHTWPWRCYELVFDSSHYEIIISSSCTVALNTLPLPIMALSASACVDLRTLNVWNGYRVDFERWRNKPYVCIGVCARLFKFNVWCGMRS